MLETGLGGLYDCTNIITKSIVSVITSIGYDHMHIVRKSDISNYSFDNKLQHFDYKNIKGLSINLKGKMQIQNASLCIEVMNILNENGYKVDIENIKNGLKTVIHKGRMEELNSNPIIVYAGAHNELAIRNLQDMVKMYYNNFQRVYIISILKRKDYRTMLKLLSKDSNAMFILTSGNDEERYASKEDLFECMKEFVDTDRISKKELRDAISDAMKSQDNTVNLVVGSFYVYSTVVDEIEKQK